MQGWIWKFQKAGLTVPHNLWQMVTHKLSQRLEPVAEIIFHQNNDLPFFTQTRKHIINWNE